MGHIYNMKNQFWAVGCGLGWTVKKKVWAKEYIERRHGEPFKFLFLPKMGLLGSQAVLEKKVQF